MCSIKASIGKSLICFGELQPNARRASLHATFLRNRILAAIRDAKDPLVRQAASGVTPNLVFEHPTLRELAETISQLVDPTGSRETVDLSAVITTLLEKYSVGLPMDVTTHKFPSSTIVVLLTGSTGNVGSHVLASLLSEPHVKKVFTLNRRGARADRQKASFADRGISIDLLSQSKLVQLFGDVALDAFGVDEHVYREVCLTLSMCCLPLAHQDGTNRSTKQ